MEELCFQHLPKMAIDRSNQTMIDVLSLNLNRFGESLQQHFDSKHASTFLDLQPQFRKRSTPVCKEVFDCSVPLFPQSQTNLGKVKLHQAKL